VRGKIESVDGIGWMDTIAQTHSGKDASRQTARGVESAPASEEANQNH
jgi:hypothetical protein